MNVQKFSERIKELIKNDKSINVERSIFPLLNIAKGKDPREMLWHMLRILHTIEGEKKDVIEKIQSIQNDPNEIEKYFYGFIIGIMNAYSGEE